MYYSSDDDDYMSEDSVTMGIEPAYSPKPHRYNKFVVKCYSHYFNTTVTAIPGVVRDWIYHMRRNHTRHLLRGELMVGLGVQWRPDRFPGDNNPAATLQLAVGHECLIFQLRRAPRAPKTLQRLLEDPDITKVGINNHSDVFRLESTALGFSVANVVDLRRVANSKGYCNLQVSLEELANEILGMEGIKKVEDVGRSNWEADVLTEEQVEYACLDASLCFQIGELLKAWEWKTSY